jgi:hypothetical protein
MIPSLSKYFLAASETFGISLVISSSPFLVPEHLIVYSSILIEVYTSSLTNLSEIIIASS